MIKQICKWCKNSFQKAQEIKCPICGMALEDSDIALTSVQSLPKLIKGRKSAPREMPFSEELNDFPVLGIDPGARYTGVVIRDNDIVLYSSIFVRPKEMDAVPWAHSVIRQLAEVTATYSIAGVGIEGVSDPKGFNKGKRAPINPKDIMRAAVVLGACAASYPHAVIVPPGGNGSQHISHYPATLIGRRPKDLPGSNSGAGTRSHEQSAYDVAGKAYEILTLQNDNLT